MKKTIRVNTNDPKNAIIELHLNGKVKLFATVEPTRVNLQGVLGETISRTVTIIPETEPPFKILQVNAMKGTEFTHSLKEAEVKGKKAYELTVVNKKATEGRYYDKLIILTDQTDHPPLTLIVSGELRKPGAENAGSESPLPPEMEMEAPSIPVQPAPK
jgi:hypothetical protein